MNARKKTSTAQPAPPAPLPETAKAFEQFAVDNLYHIHGQAIQSASHHDVYMALSYTVRDYLIDRWRQDHRSPLRRESEIRLLPVGGVSCRASNCAQNMLYTGHGGIGARGTGQARPVSLEDYLGPRRRTGAGQRRSGPVGSLLPRFPGHAGHPGRRLWDSLRVRHLSARRSRTAGKSRSRTSGCCTAIRGNFPSRTTWCEVGFWGHTETTSRTTAARGHAGCPAAKCWANPAPRWCPATAPTR